MQAASKGIKQWFVDAADVPWTDRPGALEELERRFAGGHYDHAEFEFLRGWIVDGYGVIENSCAPELIDAMLRDIDNVWAASVAIPGLTIQQIEHGDDGPKHISHESLIKLEPEKIKTFRAFPLWRIAAFYEHSVSAFSLLHNPRLLRLISLILDSKVTPLHTFNFHFGTEQGLHQDLAHTHIVPLNHLVGAWLACEDVHPDSGPLIFYPGSHRERLFEGFDNYPQTNLRTCPPWVMKAYGEYVQRLRSKYEKRTFLGRKGDVLLLHAMLLHGAEKILNHQLTRRSYVCHYITEGTNKAAEIQGPFNW